MIVKMHFDSYLMDNDTITLEADTIEEIRQMFSDWLKSRGMDEDIAKHNAWSEVVE